MGIWIIVIGAILGLITAGSFFWVTKDKFYSFGSFLISILMYVVILIASFHLASEVDPALFTSTVECTQCGHANEPDDAYCAECGYELLPTCDGCGTAMEEHDKFCPSCGTQAKE